MTKIYENLEDNEFQEWKKRWQERVSTDDSSSKKYLKLMRSVNPLVIPRNNKVEEALKEANKDNIKPLNKLLDILNRPYTEHEDLIKYQAPSIPNEGYQTFCGT